jgi:hypothetical protein
MGPLGGLAFAPVRCVHRWAGPQSQTIACVEDTGHSEREELQDTEVEVRSDRDHVDDAGSGPGELRDMHGAARA